MHLTGRMLTDEYDDNIVSSTDILYDDEDDEVCYYWSDFIFIHCNEHFKSEFISLSAFQSFVVLEHFLTI